MWPAAVLVALAVVVWSASLASPTAQAAPSATASAARAVTAAATPAPRVKGLPARPTFDPRAFPGSSAAAVRQQAAQCVVPQKLGVVYLIDDSGSMGSNDYEKLRASAVELGMREVGAGGVVAGIRFADTASTIFGATDLATTPAPGVDAIRAPLKSLGGTGYSNAFAAAKTQLASFPATVDQKIVVLLSDGEPTDGFNAATEVPALGARIYPIGFGSADNAQLAQIAGLSGGLTQAVASDQSTQGAISRAVASARCQPVDAPETFDLAPGQSRRVPFTIPANQPSFSAIATWGKGAIDVTLVRPDGTLMAPGATNPTESLEVTASTARAAVTSPPAGVWTVVLKAKQENVRKISVAIDLLGGGNQQHPMENEPSPLGEGCTTSFTANQRVAWSRCFRAIEGGVESTEPVRIAGIDLTPVDGKPIRILSAGGRLESDNVDVSIFAR
ncbi:MAG: VWA domain-containing protein, partial [Solirubrobacteraceae bacterium]|nr:VWA domain-containing protein [Solirubrobacteraceae bacterium]